jgi:hypothetical protein
MRPYHRRPAPSKQAEFPKAAPAKRAPPSKAAPAKLAQPPKAAPVKQARPGANFLAFISLTPHAPYDVGTSAPVEASAGAGAPEAGHLGEERLKSCHSVADEVSEMLDRFQHRPRLENLRLIERYIKREFHLLVHFHIREVNKEFVALFERAEDVGGTDGDRNVRPDLSRKKFSNFRCARETTYYKRANINATKAGPDSHKCAVLVDVVKAMQDPEIVTLSSFVWFESAESINSVLPHALYFSGNKAFVFRGLRSNKKASFMPIHSGAGADEIELLGKVIESGSEILNGVSQDHRNFSGDLFDSRHIIDQLSRLRIVLGQNFVWVYSVEGHNSVIQIGDVLIGPFNFMPYKS